MKKYLLFLVLSLLVLPSAWGQNVVPPEWRVIELVNTERTLRGLPPLRHNAFLEAAARQHNQAMVDGNFFDHVNPQTGSESRDRIDAVGYSQDPSVIGGTVASGENIAKGQVTPEDVMQDWMNSPGHRDNILNENFREIGVSYLVAADGSTYWTQNFGLQETVYPIVIENEAWQTSDPTIELFVYGADFAQDLRYAINGGVFSDYQAFSETLSLKLPSQSGQHEVTVELRSANGDLQRVSDDIYLEVSSAVVATIPATPSVQIAATQASVTNLELIRPGDSILGNSAGNLALVGFYDLSACELCADFHTQVLPQLIAQYPELQFTWRNTLINPASADVAQGVECAVLQGLDRQALLTSIYTSQSTDYFASIALPDPAAWQACMSSQRYESQILAENQAAQDLGVSGVPVFFLNGRSISNPASLTGFQTLLDRELARLQLSTPVVAATASPQQAAQPASTAVPATAEAAPQTPRTITLPKVDWIDRVLSWPWHLILPLLFLLLLLPLLTWLMKRTLFFWQKCEGFLCLLCWTALAAWIGIAGFAIGLGVNDLNDVERAHLPWQVDRNQVSRVVSVPSLNTGRVNSLPNVEGECLGCHVYNDNSNRLAYVNADDGSVSVLNLATEERLDTPFTSDYMSWNPEGNLLVFSHNNEDLYIYDVETEDLLPLAGAAESDFIETMPSWSPDGQSIAFVRHGNIADKGSSLHTPTDIYTIPAQGGTPSPLAAEAGVFEYYPAYSPDGQWIAFTRHSNQSTYADPEAEIWLANTRIAQAPVRLSFNDSPTPSSNSFPTWAGTADEYWLVFGTKRFSQNYDVLATQLDSSGQNGEVFLLAGASDSSIVDIRPAFTSAERVLDWGALLPALLWLLPIPLLLGLIHLICQPVTRITLVQEEIIEPPIREPLRPLVPITLEPFPGLPPLWEPKPALVIGLGRSGRWVLTHLKKNLVDAGLGNMSSAVQFLAIDTADFATTQNQDSQFSFGDVRLSDSETLALRDNMDSIRKRMESHHAIRDWLQPHQLPSAASALDLAQGAQGRREIARLGIIRNILGTSDDPSIWQAMRDKAAQVLDENSRLTVIIVGSLSDDIGSGSYLDIAYLARQLPANDVVRAKGGRVILHLIGQQALQSESVDAERETLNTGAALDELERFQLSASLPFPMRYTDLADSPSPFDKNLEEALVDELYLYDGERQAHSLVGTNPQIGIYPTIADVIAFWLDKAAHQGGLEVNRNLIRSKMYDEQNRSTSLIVSGVGIYQYRLPFYDILDHITSKFGQEVVRRLIVGNAPQTSNFKMDAAHNQEAILDTRSVNALTERFILGEINLDGVRTPPILTEFVRPLLRQQGEVGTADSSGFSEYLAATLSLILNGSSNSSIENARGGKVGYAWEFLGQVSATLASLQSDQVGDMIQQADELRQSLEAQAVYLGLGGKLEDNALSLHDRLAKRHTAAQKRREEMDKVKNRQYIWANTQDQSLTDLWYEKGLLQHVRDALLQLTWEVKGTDVQLFLHGPGQKLGLSAESIADFEDLLLLMSASYIRDLRNSNVFTDLAKELLENSVLAQTGNNLLRRSDPVLGADFVRASNSQTSLFLAGNQTISNLSDLDGYLQNNMRTSNDDLKRITNSTDPFGLTLAQAADVLPLESIDSLHKARQRAQRSPSTRYVFGAEAQAAKLQANLAEYLREDARDFHPVIRTLLANPAGTRAFLLMWAGGFVRQTSDGVELSHPSHKASFGAKYLNLPLAVDAALQFNLLTPLATLESLLGELEAGGLTDVWQAWYNQGYMNDIGSGNEDHRRILRDWASVGRLWIRDQIVKKGA